MKEIAIIGAGGRMGSWITRYFVNNKNFSIKAYDKDMCSIERQLNLKIEIDFNSMCSIENHTTNDSRMFSKNETKFIFN
jgi:dihydrodipicolinate reductase